MVPERKTTDDDDDGTRVRGANENNDITSAPWWHICKIITKTHKTVNDETSAQHPGLRSQVSERKSTRYHALSFRWLAV